MWKGGMGRRDVHFNNGNLDLREGNPWSLGHTVGTADLEQRLPDFSGLPISWVIGAPYLPVSSSVDYGSLQGPLNTPFWCFMLSCWHLSLNLAMQGVQGVQGF